MKIGVVGLGVVGGAVHEGLKILEHETSVHDIKLDTTLDDVLPTEICFICVPTPSGELGECDVSIVNDVVKQFEAVATDYRTVASNINVVATNINKHGILWWRGERKPVTNRLTRGSMGKPK